MESNEPVENRSSVLEQVRDVLKEMKENHDGRREIDEILQYLQEVSKAADIREKLHHSKSIRKDSLGVPRVTVILQVIKNEPGAEDVVNILLNEIQSNWLSEVKHTTPEEHTEHRTVTEKESLDNEPNLSLKSESSENVQVHNPKTETEIKFEATAKSEAALSWFIKVIGSVKDVMESRKSSRNVDFQASMIALNNLERNIEGWLIEALGVPVKGSTTEKVKKRVTIMGRVSVIDKDEWEIYSTDDVEVPVLSKKSDATWKTSSTGDSVKEDEYLTLEKMLGREVSLDFSVSESDIFHPPLKYIESSKLLFKKNSTEMVYVDVTFILNSGDSFMKKYKLFCFLNEIKQDVSRQCNIPVNVVCLEYDGEVLEENNTLAEIDMYATGEVTFYLSSKDPLRYPLRTEEVVEAVTVSKEYRLIDVEVDREETRTVEVCTEHKEIEKPFVGGYRNKLTGMEYHHGFSQTQPPKPAERNKTHRDTQTAEMKNKLQNTSSDRATQMWRRDYYIPSQCDKILTSQVYATAEEEHQRRGLEDKVRIIQRYWRAYKIRRGVKMLSAEYKRRVRLEEMEITRRAAEKEFRHRKCIIYQSFPRTRADFDMMYSMIERWRRNEMERINETKMEGTKKAECYSILEQEILLLRAIEGHRLKLKNEKKRKKELQLMNRCAKPISWTGAKGYTIQMDTLGTQRARELKELFHTLCRENVTLEERVELIMSLKQALLPYNNQRVARLTQLLDRECEFLLAGLVSEELDMLRMRIKRMFLDYLRDPEFNPEAAKYSMAYNLKGMEATWLYCKRCSKLLPHNKFSYDVRMKSVLYCNSCNWIENIAISRLEITPFRHIQRTVMKDERRRRCISSVAFIMQDVDYYFLIMHIWHSRSVLSERENIDELRLPRWDASRDWAPWNCVLLTDDEARAHEKIISLQETYAFPFIRYVGHKNELSRVHFNQLYKMNEHFLDSGEWFSVKDDIKYVAPSSEADIFL